MAVVSRKRKVYNKLNLHGKNVKGLKINKNYKHQPNNNIKTQFRKHISDFSSKDKVVFNELLEGLTFKGLRQEFHLIRKSYFSIDLYETKKVLKQLKEESKLIEYVSAYGERNRESRWVQRITFVFPYDEFSQIVPEGVNQQNNKEYITIVYDITLNTITTAFFSKNTILEENKNDFYKIYNNMKNFEVRPYKEFGYFLDNKLMQTEEYTQKDMYDNEGSNETVNEKGGLEQQIRDVVESEFKLFNHFQLTDRVIREMGNLVGYFKKKYGKGGTNSRKGRYYILLSDDKTSYQELSIIYFGDKVGNNSNIKLNLTKKNGKNIKLKNYGKIKVKFIEVDKTKFQTEYLKDNKEIPGKNYLKEKTYNHLAITYDIETAKVNVSVMHDDYKNELEGINNVNQLSTMAIKDRDIARYVYYLNLKRIINNQYKMEYKPRYKKVKDKHYITFYVKHSTDYDCGYSYNQKKEKDKMYIPEILSSIRNQSIYMKELSRAMSINDNLMGKEQVYLTVNVRYESWFECIIDNELVYG